MRAGCVGVPRWFAHGSGEGFADFWEVADTMEPAPLVAHAASTDIIRLAYTGGTTGKPKGVMLANLSVWMQAVLLMAARVLRPGTRVLCPTPISHGAAAMIVPTLALGGTFVLKRGFDPDHFTDGVKENRIGSV